jgi:predicted transcriptional regulator
MHPKEREYLDAASTLVVTVESSQQFHDDVTAAIEALDRGESVDESPTLSFTSYDELLTTFTPTTLDLIDTIRREEPTSINETARAVDRDVKNVHEQLVRLDNMGVIYFAEEGQAKRPVVWFDELIMRVPFTSESNHAAAAP